MSQSQHQVQAQRQGLSTFILQQKLRLLNLLHLPALALEEYLQNQLEENPALEEGKPEEEEVYSNEEKEAEAESPAEKKLAEIAQFFEDDEIPDYKTYVSNAGKDEPYFTSTVPYRQSFQELLKDQLKEINCEVERKHLIEYLIDSLDEDGYLRTPLGKLCDDYSFAHEHLMDEQEAEKALQELQQFDPPGI